MVGPGLGIVVFSIMLGYCSDQKIMKTAQPFKIINIKRPDKIVILTVNRNLHSGLHQVNSEDIDDVEGSFGIILTWYLLCLQFVMTDRDLK